MNSEEIRGIQKKQAVQFESLLGDVEQTTTSHREALNAVSNAHIAFWLSEIALQLAVKNELKQRSLDLKAERIARETDGRSERDA